MKEVVDSQVDGDGQEGMGHAICAQLVIGQCCNAVLEAEVS